MTIPQFTQQEKEIRDVEMPGQSARIHARIVFDLDGTLIDSAPDIHAIGNAVLFAEGADPVEFSDTRRFIGNGTEVFIQRLRAARGIGDAAQERMHGAFLDRYDSAVGLTRPYSHVVPVLEGLAKTHRLGICTNKPYRPAVEVLDHLSLSRFFEAVVGGDSLPERKPDPKPLRAVSERLGDGPVLYIGDSEVDAETAKRAGVPFLLFSMGYARGPIEDMGAHAVFNDWREVPDLVTTTLIAVSQFPNTD